MDERARFRNLMFATDAQNLIVAISFGFELAAHRQHRAEEHNLQF